MSNFISHYCGYNSWIIGYFIGKHYGAYIIPIEKHHSNQIEKKTEEGGGGRKSSRFHLTTCIFTPYR